MYYNHYQPIQKEQGRIGIFLVAGIFALMASIGMFMPASAAETQTISGDTAAAYNEKGWLFNRDPGNRTPYEFTTDEASIGNGSLYVQPIDGSSPSDKFIGEYFLLEDMQDVESISYDFMVGDRGDEATDANHFYMNVYANFDGGTQYGDCVYNVVPDEASGWTTVTFNPDNEYDVDSRTAQTCPDSPSELPEEASLRMFAINAGDTSDNDAGLDGYYDNVVVNMNDTSTTFDFEPETELLYSLNGGGQVHGNTEGKRKTWSNISFGTDVSSYNIGNEGEIDVRFHNVEDDKLDKTSFHSTSITEFNYYEGDSDSCEAAANMTAEGTWNGNEGYELVFRAGDNGSPNTDDTVRVTLYDDTGAMVYDTSGSTDFLNESDCVGTSRTGLDKGNISVMSHQE